MTILTGNHVGYQLLKEGCFFRNNLICLFVNKFDFRRRVRYFYMIVDDFSFLLLALMNSLVLVLVLLIIHHNMSRYIFCSFCT